MVLQKEKIRLFRTEAVCSMDDRVKLAELESSSIPHI